MSETNDTVPATPEGMAAALGLILRRLDGIDKRLWTIESTLPHLATRTDLNLLEAGQKALGSEIHALAVAVEGLYQKKGAGV
jgi:hypothetical protein